MPQEEVKFFRDFFEYRKSSYTPNDTDKYWSNLIANGQILAKKYANTPFEQFVLDLIVAHQKDVGVRFNGQQEVGK